VVVPICTLSGILLLLLLAVPTPVLVSVSVSLYYLELPVHSSHGALVISLVSHIMSLIHLYLVARPLHLDVLMGIKREFDLETRVTTNGNNKSPRCFTVVH